MDGVDVKQTHTYSLDWQAGRLTMYVDGTQMWTTTDHVPADAAHGGENEAPGIGMQTWWSASSQHGSGYDNSITLFDVNYRAANGSYSDGRHRHEPGGTAPLAPTRGTIINHAGHPDHRHRRRQPDAEDLARTPGRAAPSTPSRSTASRSAAR